MTSRNAENFERKHTSILFDVHLMISPVHKYIEDYALAGADIITIHPEATDDLNSSILKIKELSTLNNRKFTFHKMFRNTHVIFKL